MTSPDSGARGLDWLTELGVPTLNDLNPCVPGEFTQPNTYYVNSATPGVVYHGTEEATLPMVSGRWYLLPGTIISGVPSLTRDTAPVARAVRLAREAGG